MRETLSLNIDSCYRSLSTVRDYPKYDPVTHILVVKIDHEDTSITSVTRYRIATNRQRGNDPLSKFLHQAKTRLTGELPPYRD